MIHQLLYAGMLGALSLFLLACGSTATSLPNLPAASPTVAVEATPTNPSAIAQPTVEVTPDVTAATPAENDDIALRWSGAVLPFGEIGDACNSLTITKSGQALIGPCEGEPADVEFGNQEWLDMLVRFAPFRFEQPEEQLVFNGQGNIGGPAWERAITAWARFTQAELASGRVGAANRTVLAWQLGELPDQPGQCRMLIVLVHGYAMAGVTPCENGSSQGFSGGWVDSAAWTQFDTWLYDQAQLYQDNNYFDGRGSRGWSAGDIDALKEWAEAVYATLNPTGSLSSEPPLFVITAEAGKYGFIDATGQVVTPPQYDYAERFIEGRAMVQRGDKWGFLDETGQEVIPPQYDSASSFTEGVTAVLQAGRWGVIDRNGQVVIPPQFQAPPYFRDGVAHLSTFGRWGLIDDGGQFLVEPQFDWLGEFHQNRAVMELDGKFGYLEPGGQVVIEPQSDQADRFPLDGEADPVLLAPVQLQAGFGYIDLAGQMVIEPQFAFAGPFAGGLAVALPSYDDPRFGYIDETGQFVIEPQFDGVNAFGGDGYAAVYLDGKWGFIDRAGKVVIEPQFDGYNTLFLGQPAFPEGLAAVSRDGRWGFIDPTGRFVIEPQFSFAENFANGAARVELDGQYGYINRQGEFIWGPVKSLYGIGG